MNLVDAFHCFAHQLVIIVFHYVPLLYERNNYIWPVGTLANPQAD